MFYFFCLLQTHKLYQIDEKQKLKFCQTKKEQIEKIFW